MSPVYKEGERNIHLNYRAIAHLFICFKALENLIDNYIHFYVDGNNLQHLS